MNSSCRTCAVEYHVCKESENDVVILVGVMQMYYDDLPIWGFIGKIEKILRPGKPEWRYYIFTHIHFDISYNKDRVIEINVSTDPMRTVDITDGDDISVDFSYSVRWKETAIPFDRRME
eukprot:8284169-Pyramimonas_sp.AAC.1